VSSNKNKKAICPMGEGHTSLCRRDIHYLRYLSEDSFSDKTLPVGYMWFFEDLIDGLKDLP
jgi:hypothetical protein